MSRSPIPTSPQSMSRPPSRAYRLYADKFPRSPNPECEKLRIPCQDTDLVDFMQVIR